MKKRGLQYVLILCSFTAVGQTKYDTVGNYIVFNGSELHVIYEQGKIYAIKKPASLDSLYIEIERVSEKIYQCRNKPDYGMRFAYGYNESKTECMRKRDAFTKREFIKAIQNE